MADVIIIINNGSPVKTKQVITIATNGGKIYEHNSNYTTNSGIVNSTENKLTDRFDEAVVLGI